MAGRPSPQNPLISQLTLPPETITSCYPGIRHTEFQPHSGRHPMSFGQCRLPVCLGAMQLNEMIGTLDLACGLTFSHGCNDEGVLANLILTADFVKRMYEE